MIDMDLGPYPSLLMQLGRENVAALSWCFSRPRPLHQSSGMLLGLIFAATMPVVCGCKKAPPAPPPPPMVQVADITTTNVPLQCEFIGQLDSPQNVEVRARVEAFVDKMLFTEGTEVKEGDPLFALDKKPSQERLAAAEGMLAEAKAALNKYEKDVARLAPLAQKRAVPQQDLDNAVASVDVGKAAVLSAQARVQSAQIDLSYCDVRSPITGLIGAKQVSIGELVGKGQPTLMATISTLDPIWFYCNVSEARVSLRPNREPPHGQEPGRHARYADCWRTARSIRPKERSCSWTARWM